MRKRFRKTIALLLSVILILVMLPAGVVSVSAMSQADFNNRIAQQQTAYPNGSVCYSTQFGQSCFGWAYLMGNNVFGSSPSNWATSDSLSSVKIGDIIQYGNTKGQGHTVFVVGVSGDIITFADCNGNGNGTRYNPNTGKYEWIPDLCKVKWDNTTTISSNSLFSYSFSYIKSAPEIITESYIDFCEGSVSNISANNATISTWANNNGAIYQMGFYISSNGNQYNKIITNDATVEWTRFILSYNLIEKYGHLSPGQTYYYKFFVVKNEGELCSNVASFQTTGNPCISFDTYDIPGVGEISARTRAWMSNPNGKLISEIGIICSQERNVYDSVPVTQNVSWTRSHLNYELCEYVGALIPDTSYYVRYYAIVDGVTYYSDYFMFTTYAKVKFDTYEITGEKVSDITAKAWIDNPNGITMDSVGFAISFDRTEYTKVEVYSNKTWTRTHQIYKINDYYKLTPNTNYTIKHYVKAGGVEYYGKEFRLTPKNDISFDTYGNPSVSEDKINISTWFSNDNGVNIKSLGFMLGESNQQMEIIETKTNICWTRANLSYDILDYKAIFPNTRYYYYFYVKVGDTTYYSDMMEFTSPERVNNKISPTNPVIEYIIGDTNLDGSVNVNDVTAIQRHLVELEAFNEEQLTLADTNGDGEIDIADATHLQMYLAEYDVVLGKT